MDKIFHRELERRSYVPALELLERTEKPYEAMRRDDPAAKALSQLERKQLREQFHAACLGVMVERAPAQVPIGVEVGVGEIADADCLLRVRLPHPKPPVYWLVQLKEIPPASNNPKFDLKKMWQTMAKQAGARELIFAIAVSREIEIAYGDLESSILKVGQIWFIASGMDGTNYLDGGPIDEWRRRSPRAYSLRDGIWSFKRGV